MIQNILKDKQPQIYHHIKNASLKRMLSQSYMIIGEDNNLKLDIAYFIAQCIIEDSFACETCLICKRIKENKYYDLIYIDCTKDILKKEQLSYIYNRFLKHAIEDKGKKIYIINNIENAHKAACNSLLKFLEEPNGQNIHAILLSSNKDKLLDTIKSRCNVLELRLNNNIDIYTQYKVNGYQLIDAYLLSNIKNIYDPNLINDNYNIAIDGLKQYINVYMNNIELFLFYIYDHIDNKEDKYIISSLLISMIILYHKDQLTNNTIHVPWYDYKVDINKDKIYKIIDCLYKISDKMNVVYDIKQMFEQFIYNYKYNIGE